MTVRVNIDGDQVLIEAGDIVGRSIEPDRLTPAQATELAYQLLSRAEEAHIVLDGGTPLPGEDEWEL